MDEPLGALDRRLREELQGEPANRGDLGWTGRSALHGRTEDPARSRHLLLRLRPLPGVHGRVALAGRRVLPGVRFRPRDVDGPVSPVEVP